MSKWDATVFGETSKVYLTQSPNTWKSWTVPTTSSGTAIFPPLTIEPDSTPRVLGALDAAREAFTNDHGRDPVQAGICREMFFRLSGALGWDDEDERNAVWEDIQLQIVDLPDWMVVMT